MHLRELMGQLHAYCLLMNKGISTQLLSWQALLWCLKNNFLCPVSDWVWYLLILSWPKSCHYQFNPSPCGKTPQLCCTGWRLNPVITKYSLAPGLQNSRNLLAQLNGDMWTLQTTQWMKLLEGRLAGYRSSHAGKARGPGTEEICFVWQHRSTKSTANPNQFSMCYKQLTSSFMGWWMIL